MKNQKHDERLIYELWQNAAFDEGTYRLVDQIVKDLSSKERSRRLPIQEIYFELATIRNRNLISRNEQLKLRKTVVAFFGLSVGSHSALTWMMLSRADEIKIIDPDDISPTNLNRLRFGWDSVGKKKIDVVGKALLKINPFVKIFKSNNTSSKSLIQTLSSLPKVDVVVDAIDKIEDKLLLRKTCKEKKIPLLSAADVGDNIFLDIERYDLYPQPIYFLGRIPNIEKVDFSKLTELGRKRLLIRLVGLDFNSERMLKSLYAIGDTVNTWPQLGSTATIAGGLITTAIKKILIGEALKSGRYKIDLDGLLMSDSVKKRKRKSQLIKKVKKKFKMDW